MVGFKLVPLGARVDCLCLGQSRTSGALHPSAGQRGVWWEALMGV